MANTIRHQGIVENISGSHLQVRIVQTSACAGCNVKGHCSVADSKEKLIDVTTAPGNAYRQGDRVWVVGTNTMGAKAVVWAFVLPFVLMTGALFLGMWLWGNELYAGLASLLLLLLYYGILRLNRTRLRKHFSFSVEPCGEESLFC